MLVNSNNIGLNRVDMDIELARTFLEIAAAGSFMRAAERLHVTQTTVSARIKSLEEQLGQPLFVRNRAGARLTRAGEQFHGHARTLVQVWQRARAEVALPADQKGVVAIGAELSLWDPFLLDWLLLMRTVSPDLAVRASVGLAEQLLEGLERGIIDLAIVYSPRYRKGLKVEPLLDERLVLVTAGEDRSFDAMRERDYVHVDWGGAFRSESSLLWPGGGRPDVLVDFGPLGLQYVLRTGRAGYFRYGAVAPHLQSGALRLVEDAPEFLHPAFIVYAEDADPRVLGEPLAALRRVTAGKAAVPSAPST